MKCHQHAVVCEGGGLQGVVHEEQGIVGGGADDFIESGCARSQLAHQLQRGHSHGEELGRHGGRRQRLPVVGTRAAEHVAQRADSPENDLRAEQSGEGQGGRGRQQLT